ncbi:MAG: hypothetical protein ACK5LN_08820 [Propioniciclava sp.]
MSETLQHNQSPTASSSDTGVDTPSPGQISRRRLTQGVAWAAPVVLAAHHAPAMATTQPPIINNTGACNSFQGSFQQPLAEAYTGGPTLRDGRCDRCGNTCFNTTGAASLNVYLDIPLTVDPASSSPVVNPKIVVSIPCCNSSIDAGAGHYYDGATSCSNKCGPDRAPNAIGGPTTCPAPIQRTLTDVTDSGPDTSNPNWPWVYGGGAWTATATNPVYNAGAGTYSGYKYGTWTFTLNGTYNPGDTLPPFFYVLQHFAGCARDNWCYVAQPGTVAGTGCKTPSHTMSTLTITSGTPTNPNADIHQIAQYHVLGHNYPRPNIPGATILWPVGGSRPTCLPITNPAGTRRIECCMSKCRHYNVSGYENVPARPNSIYTSIPDGIAECGGSIMGGYQYNTHMNDCITG